MQLQTLSSAERASLPQIQLLPSALSSDKMAPLYASVDAFVLPSRGEGWGRPHVEAMAMELPGEGS